MSSKKGQSKKIDSARRAPSRRGLAGYSAPRRKTPDERIRIYTLRAQTRSAAENAGRPTHLHPLQTPTPFTHRGGKRRKVSPSPHFTTPTPFTHRGGKRRKVSSSPHFTTPTPFTHRGGKRRKASLSPHFTAPTPFTLRDGKRRKVSLSTLQHRHRSHTAAEMSDSGYNSIFCKHHLIQQKKRRMTACPPIPPKNLRRPLITPKNTAIFIGFFFYTSPGYAAESPCFRHKHTPSFRNTFFAARITICFTIIDFPSCFFSAAAV